MHWRSFKIRVVKWISFTCTIIQWPHTQDWLTNRNGTTSRYVIAWLSYQKHVPTYYSCLAVYSSFFTLIFLTIFHLKFLIYFLSFFFISCYFYLLLVNLLWLCCNPICFNLQKKKSNQWYVSCLMCPNFLTTLNIRKKKN